MLFSEVRSLIRVVITSFYCSKLLGFLKADRQAEVISSVMSIVMVVGGYCCFHLDYCLVIAASLPLKRTLTGPELIIVRYQMVLSSVSLHYRFVRVCM